MVRVALPGKYTATGLAACAVAALLALPGCANNVPPLYGYELGEANSAVFSYDYATDGFIVVLTRVYDACEFMTTNTQPMREGDWVVSAWRTPTSIGGYFATFQGGKIEEHEATEVAFDNVNVPSSSAAHDGKPATGNVRLKFDSGDEVEFRFKADYCSRDLFAGLD